MLEIIPSVLTSDPDEAIALVSLCEGACKRVHLDINDGEFMHSKTVDPSVFKDIETTLLFDYHLMVKNPIHWIQKCIDAQAERIIGQIEHMESQESFVQTVTESGLSVGLALDLETPIEALDSNVLSQVDIILVMSVAAGHGGQSFDERALIKIEELNDLRVENQYQFIICDDGGITLDTIALTRGAGVDEVSVGRRIFAGSVHENIEHFQKAAMRYNES